MKRHSIYFLFAAAIISAACKPENNLGKDNLTPQTAESLKITARNIFHWNKADKISIFDGKSNNQFRSQGAGESAVLSGEAIHSEVLYGLSPYDPKASLADKTISASIPEKQIITASQYPNIAVAKTKDINSMVFEPIAGFLQIDIAEDAKGIESISIASAAGETIAGAFSIDMSGDKGILSASSTVATVSATAFEESFKAGEKYYIAVFPGTYAEGFTVFYTIKGETSEMSVSGPKTVSAGKAIEMGKIKRPFTANEKLFLGQWQVSKWGSRSHNDPTGQHTWISIDKGVPLPETTKDDIVTFNADGLLGLDLGADNKAYNVAEKQAVSVELTGQETWSLEENSENAPTLKLSGNGFPALLGDINGLTTDYSVRSISPAEICLEYDQPDKEAFFQVYLQPKGVETSAHTFKKGDFGLNAEVNEEMSSHEGPATTEDGINWYLETEMGQELFIWKSWGGLQIGAGWHSNEKLHVKSMTLSSEDIPGTIKAVSITTSYSDKNNALKAELSVTVGGKNFGSRKNIVNKMTKHTFTDSSPASGKIEIKWTSKDKKISYFIKKVEVVYQK